eukprot:TRINITY_DN10680_c0_g1_i1.p1 TRINITY_DN10680_c0_g1~~TRINITY_DN10680_c0_g1_i1.p1  ORF type:complete len:643 (-),score=61.89 TRINITY_DN10680_c0_g1_i1:1194-3122(-)
MPRYSVLQLQSGRPDQPRFPVILKEQSQKEIEVQHEVISSLLRKQDDVLYSVSYPADPARYRFQKSSPRFQGCGLRDDREFQSVVLSAGTNISWDELVTRRAELQLRLAVLRHDGMPSPKLIVAGQQQKLFVNPSWSPEDLQEQIAVVGDVIHALREELLPETLRFCVVESNRDKHLAGIREDAGGRELYWLSPVEDTFATRTCPLTSLEAHRSKLQERLQQLSDMLPSLPQLVCCESGLSIDAAWGSADVIEQLQIIQDVLLASSDKTRGFENATAAFWYPAKCGDTDRIVVVYDHALCYCDKYSDRPVSICGSAALGRHRDRLQLRVAELQQTRVEVAPVRIMWYNDSLKFAYDWDAEAVQEQLCGLERLLDAYYHKKFDGFTQLVECNGHVRMAGFIDQRLYFFSGDLAQGVSDMVGLSVEQLQTFHATLQRRLEELNQRRCHDFGSVISHKAMAPREIAEHSRLQHRVSQLEVEAANSKELSSKLQADVAWLRDEVGRLRDEVRTLRAESTTLRDQLHESKVALAANNNQQVSIMQGSLVNLTEENRRLRSRLDDFVSKTRTLVAPPGRFQLTAQGELSDGEFSNPSEASWSLVSASSQTSWASWLSVVSAGCQKEKCFVATDLFELTCDGTSYWRMF